MVSRFLYTVSLRFTVIVGFTASLHNWKEVMGCFSIEERKHHFHTVRLMCVFSSYLEWTFSIEERARVHTAGLVYMCCQLLLQTGLRSSGVALPVGLNVSSCGFFFSPGLVWWSRSFIVIG